MLNLKVEFKGLDDIEKITKDKLKTVLMKSMFKMEELAINNAPVDRGFLRNNITIFPHFLSHEYVLSSNAPNSMALEYGTRPFYAPIKPLKEWAKRVLGDEDIGYAVRAKIAKEGITAHPYMRPALYAVQNFWLDYYLQQTK